jgi:hypothetical protein
MRGAAIPEYPQVSPHTSVIPAPIAIKESSTEPSMNLHIIRARRAVFLPSLLEKGVPAQTANDWRCHRKTVSRTVITRVEEEMKKADITPISLPATLAPRPPCDRETSRKTLARIMQMLWSQPAPVTGYPPAV